MTNPERILNLLSDGQPHFSAEFRDKLGLLEYRRPITKLRREGHIIKTMRLKSNLYDCYRPGYQLVKEPELLHGT